MRPFEYASPASVDEALALLGGDGATRPLAGGTDLLPLMKADIAAPSRLIDIKRLTGLSDGIAEGPEGLTIGALAKLTAIENDPAIGERYAAIAEAAAAATPQLRNMATLGGNLLQRPRCWYFRNPLFQCWLKGGDICQAREGENQQHAIFDVSPCVAVHPSDLPAALLALGASVRLRGLNGERTLPLEAFFTPPTGDHRTENILVENELVLDVRVPAPPPGLRSTYLKAMDRKVWAFALVGVAAAVRLDGGRIADARLILGGVAPVPLRATEAERALIGAAPGEGVFDRAAEAALAGATPLAKNGYKVPLARSLVRRALKLVTADPVASR